MRTTLAWNVCAGFVRGEAEKRFAKHPQGLFKVDFCRWTMSGNLANSTLAIGYLHCLVAELPASVVRQRDIIRAENIPPRPFFKGISTCLLRTSVFACTKSHRCIRFYTHKNIRTQTHN